MELHTDLHAHSAFAGGARAGGKSEKERINKILKRFHDTALYSPLKGVNLIGTGDIQFSWWREFIEREFEEDKGIFEYQSINSIPDDHIVPNGFEYQSPKYILQSEYIFTGPIPNSSNKKRVHVVTLFPDFTAVDELILLFDAWDVSHENMARPFIVCDTREEVAQKMHAIAEIHPKIELIPAHVMTPEGVYGGNNRINYLDEFFGDGADQIRAVETGLSADPTILGLIPELDDKTLLSNADAHSANLNRIGREFTSLQVNKLSYDSIINSIRNGQVVKTAEFHPTEGRYFLTGHRADRSRPGNHTKTQFCCFSPKNVPKGDLCPICDKELTIGVLQRAFEVSEVQGANREIGEVINQEYVTMVPLIEIIAHSIGVKSLNAKSVEKQYGQVLEHIYSEVNLWVKEKTIKKIQSSNLDPRIIENIIEVKNGNFSFQPGGYDGVYGSLQIGKTLDFENVKIVQG